jgi:hypothetical protein
MSKSPKPKKSVPKRRKTAKTAAVAEQAAEAGPQRLSGLAAAEVILRAAGEPMRPIDIYERAKAEGLWSPGGKTPASTLAAALCTSVLKGKGRFTKAGRGLFALASGQ